MRSVPFKNYDEYMEYVFFCINECLDWYLSQMKITFANNQGGYKNVIYPDLEVAHDICKVFVNRFNTRNENENVDKNDAGENVAGNEQEDFVDDELLALLGNMFDVPQEEATKKASEAPTSMTLEDKMEFIKERAKATIESGIKLPFYELCNKLEFSNFTVFCFACGIISSTQTDYASVFQVVNENANLSTPTIESAAKLFYGDNYSITGAYADMSVCLEQLLPILDLRVVGSMPFSTSVSPDKRVIDFLFGRNPNKLDENYIRFFKMLTSNEELDPIMANTQVLEAMEISYNEGVRIFAYFGDEGSGRKFFVKHFCEKNSLQAITINCKKLFVYDFQFVEKALWAVTRECIFLNACCCLEDLTYREEEKEKFFGYMDLAFSKLVDKGVMVFALSKERIGLKDITKEEYTELELPTPINQEREECWRYFSKKYALDKDVELPEMATKFLFTPGKIKSALHNARSLATMNKDILVSRAMLFQGCYNQMSSELTQKATKVKANFGFGDI